MKKLNIIFCIGILLVSGCKRKKVTQDRLCSRVDLAQIINLIPKTSEDIYLLCEQTTQEMEQAFAKIDQVESEDRTYVNTVLVYEQAYFHLVTHKQILKIVAELFSDSALQTAAHVALLELDEYENQMLTRNTTLYQAIQEYEKHGKDPYHHIKPVTFFIHNYLKKAELEGMKLDVAKRADLSKLEQEMMQLVGKFCNHVFYERRHLIASCDELQGVPEKFIKTLVQDEQGNCLVPLDDKTYTIIMRTCQVPATRRNYFLMFYQLGYPQNELILQELQTKGHHMAKLLNFDNFASYQLDNLMVKTPKKAESFLWNMIKDLQLYDDRDFFALSHNLPPSVTLNFEEKIEPWDYDFAVSDYRKQHFNIDDTAVAQFFPLDYVLPKMLEQLSKFFHVVFEPQEALNLWAPDIVCYRVRSLKHQAILGYVFFDLYQRFAKRDGDPYQVTMIPAIRDDCSLPCVGASVVVANFKQGTVENPTLLTFDDLSSLVYQMGYALHAVFGATRFTEFSGTQVVYDFSTVPSEVLKCWLQQSNFVQSLSQHAQTGKSLSKSIIEQLIAREKFEFAHQMLQKCFLGLVCLQIFEQQTHDAHTLIEKLYKKVFKHVAYSPQNYFEMSFLPLADVKYATAYYADVWAKVIAKDLFAHIKEGGIYNHEVGMQYVTEILSPGGSRHPSDMTKRFLGRSFNRKAFLEQI